MLALAHREPAQDSRDQRRGKRECNFETSFAI
jgi:hypothetical protein